MSNNTEWLKPTKSELLYAIKAVSFIFFSQKVSTMRSILFYTLQKCPVITVATYRYRDLYELLSRHIATLQVR